MLESGAALILVAGLLYDAAPWEVHSTDSPKGCSAGFDYGGEDGFGVVAFENGNFVAVFVRKSWTWPQQEGRVEIGVGGLDGVERFPGLAVVGTAGAMVNIVPDDHEALLGSIASKDSGVVTLESGGALLMEMPFNGAEPALAAFTACRRLNL